MCEKPLFWQISAFMFVFKIISKDIVKDIVKVIVEYIKKCFILCCFILCCLWFCRLRKLIRQRNFSHVRYWSPICWSYTEGVISNNIIRALGRKLKLLTFSQNRGIRLVFTEGRHHGWRKESFLYNQQKAGKRHPGK